MRIFLTLLLVFREIPLVSVFCVQIPPVFLCVLCAVAVISPILKIRVPSSDELVHRMSLKPRRGDTFMFPHPTNLFIG